MDLETQVIGGKPLCLTTACSMELLGNWSNKRNTPRGITHGVQSEKVEGIKLRETFSWLQISRGIYKPGYRAPGNIKGNAFPRTCQGDTETCSQGPRLSKPLHKSRAPALNCGSREALWFHRMSTLEGPTVQAFGFIKAERVAGELNGLLSQGPQSSASFPLWTLTFSLISPINKKKFPWVPLPLGNGSLLPTTGIPLP